MIQLKVTQIGNSVGVILPKEVLNHLKLQKGDSVLLSETTEGYTVTNFDPHFAEVLKHLEEGSHEYRNALRELAK